MQPVSAAAVHQRQIQLSDGEFDGYRFSDEQEAAKLLRTSGAGLNRRSPRS